MNRSFRPRRKHEIEAALAEADAGVFISHNDVLEWAANLSGKDASALENKPRKIELTPGLIYYPEYLDRAAQEDLLSQLRDIIRAAPVFTPRMPRTGKAFSVRMSNCGPLGWVWIASAAIAIRRRIRKQARRGRLFRRKLSPPGKTSAATRTNPKPASSTIMPLVRG